MDEFGILGSTRRDKNETIMTEVFFMRKRSLGIIVVAIVAVAAVVCGVLLSKKHDHLEAAFAEKINSGIVQGEDLPSDIQYMNKVLEHTSFEMMDVSSSNKTMTVSISYPNCIEIADGYTGDENNAEDYYQYAISVLDGEQMPSLTEEIEVGYQEDEDGVISFEDSEALTNALTGGTYSFLVSMMEEN